MCFSSTKEKKSTLDSDGRKPKILRSRKIRGGKVVEEQILHGNKTFVFVRSSLKDLIPRPVLVTQQKVAARQKTEAETRNVRMKTASGSPSTSTPKKTAGQDATEQISDNAQAPTWVEWGDKDADKEVLDRAFMLDGRTVENDRAKKGESSHQAEASQGQKGRNAGGKQKNNRKKRNNKPRHNNDKTFDWGNGDEWAPADQVKEWANDTNTPNWEDEWEPAPQAESYKENDASQEIGMPGSWPDDDSQERDTEVAGAQNNSNVGDAPGQGYDVEW